MATASVRKRKTPARAGPAKGAGKRTPGRTRAKRPVLLAGGNPQITKGDGEAPVRAWIAGLSGWKREVGERLDAVIARAAPGVRRAVKWNSPLYGIEGRGWFLGLHAYDRYLKVTFFRGGSLRPLPPGESKSPGVRHLDVREDPPVGEAQFADWVRQAAALPGWEPGREP